MLAFSFRNFLVRITPVFALLLALYAIIAKVPTQKETVVELSLLFGGMWFAYVTIKGEQCSNFSL